MVVSQIDLLGLSSPYKANYLNYISYRSSTPYIQEREKEMASRTSQAAILNHHQQLGLFENQEGEGSNTQMGFFPFPPNLTFSSLPFLGHQSLKGYLSAASIASDDAPSTTTLSETLVPRPSLTPPPLRHKQDHNITTTSSEFGGGGGGGGAHAHLLSMQRSTANLWAWGDVSDDRDEYCLNSKRSSGGDDHHHPYLGGVSAMKMKKMKAIRRKVREPRFSFKTLSDVDVLDDGYKWRKYGQKVVKNTQHPRSYYRCTMDNCRVKKRVERLAEDPRMVITTYEGRHVHSPSHDLEDQDSRSPSHLNNFFW